MRLLDQLGYRRTSFGEENVPIFKNKNVGNLRKMFFYKTKIETRMVVILTVGVLISF